MPTRASPSQSAEDYLERIHALIEQKGYARVVDIASSLNVRQASVTSMLQKLAEAGETPDIPVLGFLPADLKVQEADRLGVPVYDHVPALRAAAAQMAKDLDAR